MLESLVRLISDLIKSIMTFFKILLRSSLFLKTSKATSDEVIILGNGPSLKINLKEHKELLKKHTLMGVNNLPSTDAFEDLQPSYFIVISDEFWNPGSIKKHQDIRDNIITNLVAKTTWPLTFFLPASAKKNKEFIHKVEQNNNIKITFFNKTPLEGSNSISRIFMNLGWGMPRPHNVLVPSLYNCIRAGFKSIYLIGADHSWIPLISVDENNNALVNQQHFYDEHQDNKEAMHQKSKPRRLHQILEKFMLSFKAYFVLDEYAKSRGITIYNCTPGSFIDAFERKDINEVILDTKQQTQISN